MDSPEDFFPLVHRAVNAACRRYPAFAAYRDDMVSAGYVALLETLDGPPREHLRQYLAATLRRAVLVEANKLHETYRAPRSEGRVRRARHLIGLEDAEGEEDLTSGSLEDAILLKIDLERAGHTTEEDPW